MIKKYRVKIRRELNDVKPEAEQIDGNVYKFYIGWEIDDIEHYIGEMAMIPTRDCGYPEDAPIWIASGDLEEVK